MHRSPSTLQANRDAALVQKGYQRYPRLRGLRLVLLAAARARLMPKISEGERPCMRKMKQGEAVRMVLDDCEATVGIDCKQDTDKKNTTH